MIRRRLLRTLSLLLTSLLITGATGAQTGPSIEMRATTGSGDATAFPYSGQLDFAGAPADGLYDFDFELWDAAEGGTLLGGVTRFDVPVREGRFLVPLDFGVDLGVDSGGDRWLQVMAREAGGGGFTALTPRQNLQALLGTCQVAGGLLVDSSITVASAPVVGILVQTTGSNGLQINDAGIDGIHIQSAGFDGIRVTSAGEDGLRVTSAAQNGVTVGTSIRSGLRVVDAGEHGVYVDSANLSGIRVNSAGGSGVRVDAAPLGVLVDTTTSNGLQINNAGVDGIQIQSAGRDGIRVSSAGGLAGNFGGDVHVNGTLTKSSGSFLIDHPLDPRNRFLAHSFVESPDMMNVYNGNVLLDDEGAAWVELPNYFEALNRELRYQLTPIGGPAVLFVDEEVRDNRFRIAGGEPGMKVSWQLTGVRQDPYAEVNRIVVERDKPLDERGSYLHPEVYETMLAVVAVENEGADEKGRLGAE